MVSDTVPLLRLRLPEIGVAPSRNTTLPVAEAGVTFAMKVSELPNTDGLFPALKLNDVVEFALGLFTVCENAADVEALKFASPLYCAVME
jgi:hypothetical protein